MKRVYKVVVRVSVDADKSCLPDIERRMRYYDLVPRIEVVGAGPHGGYIVKSYKRATVTFERPAKGSR